MLAANTERFSWAAKTDSSGGAFEAGTVNIGLMAGLCQALKDAKAELSPRREHLALLRKELESRCLGLPGVSYSSWEGEYAPGIVSLILPPDRPSWDLADVLFQRFAVAAKPFRPPETPNALRISFAPWTDISEIDGLQSALRATLEDEFLTGPSRQSGAQTGR